MNGKSDAATSAWRHASLVPDAATGTLRLTSTLPLNAATWSNVRRVGVQRVADALNRRLAGDPRWSAGGRIVRSSRGLDLVCTIPLGSISLRSFQMHLRRIERWLDHWLMAADAKVHEALLEAGCSVDGIHAKSHNVA